MKFLFIRRANAWVRSELTKQRGRATFHCAYNRHVAVFAMINWEGMLFADPVRHASLGEK